MRKTSKELLAHIPKMIFGKGLCKPPMWEWSRSSLERGIPLFPWILCGGTGTCEKLYYTVNHNPLLQCIGPKHCSRVCDSILDVFLEICQHVGTNKISLNWFNKSIPSSTDVSNDHARSKGSQMIISILIETTRSKIGPDVSPFPKLHSVSSSLPSPHPSQETSELGVGAQPVEAMDLNRDSKAKRAAAGRAARPELGCFCGTRNSLLGGRNQCRLLVVVAFCLVRMEGSGAGSGVRKYEWLLLLFLLNELTDLTQVVGQVRF